MAGRQDGEGRGAERMEKWYTDREEGRGGGYMAGRRGPGRREDGEVVHGQGGGKG
jgi:hypothetical protein